MIIMIFMKVINAKENAWNLDDTLSNIRPTSVTLHERRP
jgi:hypothetical protein